MKSPSSAIARRTIVILVLWTLTTTLVVSSYSSHVQSLAKGSSAHGRERFAKGSALDRTDRKVVSEAVGVFNSLPLRFEAYRGQANSTVQFLSRGVGYGLYLSPTEAALHLQNMKDGTTNTGIPPSTVLIMKLEGADAASKMHGLDELPGKTNYMIGKDQKDWRTNVPSYARVEQKDVYPGVDLIYYGNHRELEYDFRISPGARVGGIKLNFEGSNSLRIDASGDLILSTASGDVRQKKPFAYQEVNGVQREIASRYVLKGKHRVGFKVGGYDRTRALVIDPVLIYSSYLGFEGQAKAVAIDDSGSMYITGNTVSNTLPVTPGAFQSTRGNNDPFFDNSFVAKVNAAGNALVYLTYIGGEYVVSAEDIAVDAGGNAYITGSAASSNFPTTAGALKSSYDGTCQNQSSVPIPDPTPKHCYDAFVTKLNPTGTALVYSTFLGGNMAGDFGRKVKLDASGNAFVVGYTLSRDFPITAGALQSVFRSQASVVPSSLFVSKLNSTGSALIYSTYLGGSGNEGNVSVGTSNSPIGLAVDSGGNAYIAGTTNSPDFPVTPGAIQSELTRYDGFVAKLNASGTALLYSTYLGGSAEDGVHAIAVDAQGSAYVTGATYSTDFPVANAFQTSALAPFYRSANAGVTWSAANIPRVPNTAGAQWVVRSLAATPSGSPVLYMGTTDGLFKSLNHGDSWSASGLSGERVRRLTIDQHSSSTLYASTFVETNDDAAGRLYKSVDGGTSWGTPILDGAIFNAIVVDPADSSTIYVAAEAVRPGALSGILKSLDGGRTWRRINSGLISSGAAQAVSNLVIDPTNSSILYAGTVTGVFKTVNGGESWSPTAMTADTRSLQIDPRKPGTLYAATEEDDEELNARLPDPDDSRFNPRRRQIQTTESANPGLFRSMDGGRSWSAINNELGSNPLIADLAVDPGNPSTLYVAVFSGAGPNGILKSLDQGDHWERFKGLPGPSARLVVVDPQDSFVYAGFVTGSLFGTDAFITKLDPSGTTLVYSSYIGGANGREEGKDIAVDSAGNAYVAGETDSDDFNVTSGAFATTFVGRSFVPDVFVTKVSREGSLLYSTYLGGDNYDNAYGIVVDSRGIAYVTGATSSDNFPKVDAFRSGLSSIKRHDPFIAKLDLSGSAAANAPRISSTTVSGKKLIVVGEGFKEGAVVVLAGVEQKTANDSQSPSTRLIAKKAGKRVKPGSQVMIQVKNPDGATSAQFIFAR